MEAEQIPKYGGTSRVPKKPQGPRRILNSLEEQTLISCLHELVANGWKADNGFRAGYLQALEKAMNARLPNCKIGVRHINSKLTVWKKHYYLLVAMLGTSGFGWNDSAKVLEVNDDVWNEYVKANKEVGNMRTKSWRYYDDWCELFGKDRANGDDAAGFVDVVEDILLNDNPSVGVMGNRKDVVHDYYTPEYDISSPCVDLTTDASDGVVGGSKPHVNQFGVGGSKRVLSEKKQKLKLKRDRKRKTPDTTTPPPYVPFLTAFLEETKSAFGSCAPKLNKVEDQDDERAAKVISALEGVPGLSEEEMNLLCFKIMDNPKHTSLFLRSSERNREIQAKLMLQGKMA